MKRTRSTWWSLLGFGLGGFLLGIALLLVLLALGRFTGLTGGAAAFLPASVRFIHTSPLTPTPTPTPTVTPSPTPLPIREKALVRDVYAVVRYVTAPDPGEITREDVRRRWFQGDQPPLYVTQAAYEGLLKIFFAPPAREARVYVVPSAQALIPPLRRHPDAWGILPFDRLLPLLVPLPFEGLDLLDPTLSREMLDDYYLSRSRIVKHTWPHSNREPDRFHVMWVGGATTLKGPWEEAFASRERAEGSVAALRPIWRTSSWVHVQWDVPLKPTCASSDPACARPERAQRLAELGVNGAGVASPFLARAGRGAALYTQNTLREKGIRAFGVGRLLSTEVAYTWTVAGHRIALVSASVPSGPGQWATREEPGPLPLDPQQVEDWVWLVERLAQAHDAVILFVRWRPTYDVPGPQMRGVFDMLHGAGATAVIGVQPGHPQPIAFDSTGIRAYGLGSFLVGQEPRALALRLYFYDGRLINVRPDVLVREKEAWRPAPPSQGDVLRTLIEAP